MTRNWIPRGRHIVLGLLLICGAAFVVHGRLAAQSGPESSPPAAPGKAAKGHTAPPAELPAGVKLIKDLPYVADGHERNKLDLYLPEKADAPLPVVLYVHGGAWETGSKDAARVFLTLVEHGYALAACNYRLSQDAKYPAQIEDCKGAVRWLRANAAKYHLDPDHIGAMGGSAGGHLAALLGTAGNAKQLEGKGGNLDESSGVQAVVDLFGPTDLLQMNGMNGRHGGPDSPEAKLLGGPVAEHKDLAEQANPITYISSKTPPFLILHGVDDKTVPIAQSELLADALKKAGIDVTFVRIEGAGHGGTQFHSAERMQTIVQFFDKHLKAAK